MRFYYLLLTSAIAALASSSSFATAEEISNGIVSGGRLLRVTKTIDDDNSDTTSTEERGWVNNIADDVANFVNLSAWVNAGKSDDFVKQALGLEKLSEQALKASPKYKVFQQFLDKMDEQKVKKWLYEDTTTDEVWRILGLNKLTEDQIKGSKALKTYVRYATKLDDDIWNVKRASFEPDLADPKEMAVKVKLWAKAGRPQSYVFEMMGKNAMKESPNYKYYKAYPKLLKGNKQ